MKLIDLTGMVFGKLTVVERGPNAERFPQPPRWYCQCSCGNKNRVLVEGGDLRRVKTGNRTCEGTRSCGCGGDGIAGSKNKTHGVSKTGAYHSYMDMHSRCYSVKNKEFHNYGERGIAVCPRWHRDCPEGLQNFLSDLGVRPTGGSLERKDFNLGYSPENCCWVPKTLQARNTRVVVNVTLNGVEMLLSDAARACKVSPSYIKYHCGRGRTVDWVYGHVLSMRSRGKMTLAQEGWERGRD